MKSHVLRPLWVFLGVVLFAIIARTIIVPGDFGVHERGYMYGWYRKGAVEDWKKIKVKYKGSDYCQQCHSEKHKTIKKSPHAIIQCENCHGPALDHPDKPEKLQIVKSRLLCLRCHAKLLYPKSKRAKIKGIDPQKHNTGTLCTECHNPHKPSLEGLK